MPNQSSRGFLRLVKPIERRPITQEVFETPSTSIQRNLFPVPRPGMLIFVDFSSVTQDEFCKTIEFANPSAIIELRSAPRFDIGSLNRRLAFECFERQHAAYFDLTARLIHESQPCTLVAAFQSLLDDGKVDLERPMMFLLNRRSVAHNLVDEIVRAVSEVVDSATELYEIPQVAQR